MHGYPPPLDSGRNPFELFVLGFSILVGAPLLWGAPPPGSTTELLGPTLAHVWAWILVVGCATALLGVFWPGAFRCPRATGTGLLIEQVGLVAVGVGDLLYAIAVVVILGPLVPAGIVGGFGLACWWRAWLIQRWVRAAIREQQDQ